MNRYVLTLTLLAASTTLLPANTRYAQYSRQFDAPTQAAVPVAAGYLGGPGEEYLSGAAFLPDRSLILGGNALGPTFALSGVTVRVLGEDRAAPDFVLPMDGDNPRPPNWTHTAGAPFLVHLKDDYTTLDRAVRLPWGSASLTDIAADGDGNLYLAGIIGPHFGTLGTAREAGLPEAWDGSATTYLARLSPNWDGFVWLRTIPDDAEASPRLRVLEDGTISLLAAHAYHFDQNGEVQKATRVGLTNAWVGAIDHLSHANIRGEFRRTRTGWEPWHQPIFRVHNADGEVEHILYEWASHLVGTNWSRLVSDSATRTLNFDRRGQIIHGGWSDGGNSVFAHVPYDLTVTAQHGIRELTGARTGLPFSTWGANVGSFLHLNRIDPETANPVTYTLFIAYLASRNAPSSVHANMLDTATDNSLLIGGGSAFGLIETGQTKLNTLRVENGDYMGGNFIAVLNNEWNDIRFSSVIPGGGQVPLQRHSARRHAVVWTDSASFGDETLVAFVGGAVHNEAFTPVNPVQDGFGGGTLDGQYVVLRMETLAEPEPVEPAFPTAAGRTASVPDTDDSLRGHFIVDEGMNRQASVIVLRDSTATKWPAIYLGRPEGLGLINAEGEGAFRLHGPGDNVQLAGSRNDFRRLGGIRGEEGYPDIHLQVRLAGNDRAYGQVTYRGRTIDLGAGALALRPSRPTGPGINVMGYFSTTREVLGLSEQGGDPEDRIYIQFWAPARPAPEDRVPLGSAEPAAPGTAPETSPAAGEEEVALVGILREWTNKEGQTIRARLLEKRDDRILIEREDGQQFVIEVAVLSETDQTLLRSANP